MAIVEPPAPIKKMKTDQELHDSLKKILEKERKFRLSKNQTKKIYGKICEYQKAKY